MNTNEMLAARLIAAALATPRFRGSAKLLRLAEQGDETAVAALELDSRGRDFAAMRGKFSPDVIKALALPCIAQRAAKRKERRAAREQTGASDALATRLPGGAWDRAMRDAFAEALDSAGFRTAMHSHKMEVEYVERGREGASSETRKLRPQEVGLPNAYAKIAFFVTGSVHGWSVSPSIMRVPAGERASIGMLYLSPTCRVRQGRGTNLI